ncbi:MAG: exo-alpha-sialidase [Acidobacteria bacterium]|nr:exo-alpha-sialidase [Acidobacteriota bacterium]
MDLNLQAVGRASAVLLMAGCFLGLLGCGSDRGAGGTTTSQTPMFPPATVPLVKLSTDTFTNASSQHATEVEPDSFSLGPTIVAAFQVGRISSGGASDIGFALSTNAGLSWQNGFLPGLTSFQGLGTNAAVSDPAVVYDVAQGVWIISSLTISAAGLTQVVVSRSTDGGMSWANPIPVSQTPDPDKDWISCDNSATSPFYGHCYLEWDDVSQGNRIWMSTSADGGTSWSAAVNTAGAAGGIGGQPVVQPNGTVIVPFLGILPEIDAFSSSDGGASWTRPVKVSVANAHQVAGGLRADPLPSAEIDGAGKVYLVWQDCSFRASCASNDLLLSTSIDGANWTTPARIPIDAAGSAFDHFIPGVGVNPTTSGASAQLALAYYYYPQANCTASTCALYVGFISSSDGGSSWSAPTPIAGPMSLAWLPSTTSGVMVGDYIRTSFAAGKAFPVFALAKANLGTSFDEAVYTTQAGFDLLARQGTSDVEAQPPQNRAVRSWLRPRREVR